MKLYEIETRIEEILTTLEDAEVSDEADALIEELELLQMDKKEICIWLTKKVLNNRADQAAVKAEADRLKETKERLTKEEDRLIKVLARYYPDGEDFGIAKLKYTKSQATEITDEDKVKDWLIEHKHPEVIKAKYEIQKTPLKNLLKKGEKIPGAELVDKRNPALK